ncbi:MAG: hypothetical protein J4F40_08490 [Alphaproteobacteria bacterium]|nr:hypothetical protein [Alphaproteobacteria bacterium]
MRLAVFEPDMPRNLDAVARLGARPDIPLDAIGPCGFPFSVAARSLDVVVAVGMAPGGALRRTGGFARREEFPGLEKTTP